MPRTAEAQTLANVITNMRYDYYTREYGGIFPELFHHPPSLNDRLCAKIMDAGGSQPTFRLLMEAYMTVTYGRDEPDSCWSHPSMYVVIKDLITSKPGYARQYNPQTDTPYDIVFLNAVLKRDPSMPPTEILFFNSRRPELSIRIIHLGATNDQES